MRIVALSARPDLIPGLAAPMEADWPDRYGPGGPGAAQQDLADRSRAQGLPRGRVALGAGDEALGSGALVSGSYGGQPDEGPWIGGLVLAPEARGQGIANALVAALEAEGAADASTLYATTRTAVSLLRRGGWEVLRLVGDHAVLRKDLSPGA